MNKFRKNTSLSVDKIKKFMHKIKVDIDNNKSYYLINNKTKINFVKGKEAFIPCCDFLNKLAEKINNKSIILNELESKEELKFPFLVDNPDLCNNKEYITHNILKINKIINHKKMQINGFHHDLSTNNSETPLIF